MLSVREPQTTPAQVVQNVAALALVDRLTDADLARLRSVGVGVA
jgi:hypothetical protein